MDVREKLVELSEQLRYCANVSDCENCKRWDKVCENQCVDDLLLMAADLIDEVANGVTVQAEAKLYWKPVDERTSNLTCSACDSHLGCREDAKFCPECGAKFVINEALPPKGE